MWPNCICNFSFSFSVCNIYIHACFWLIFVLFFISFSAIPNCMDICYLSFRFVSCIHAFCWLVFFHLFFSVTPLFVYIDFWNFFSLSYLLPYVYYGLHFVWLKRYFLFVSFSPVSCLLYLFGFVYLVSIFICLSFLSRFARISCQSRPSDNYMLVGFQKLLWNFAIVQLLTCLQSTIPNRSHKLNCLFNWRMYCQY